MQISEKKVALISYTLTNSEGQVLDQADEKEPFAFIAGIGNIIAGLDSALNGKVAGDALQVSIEAKDAYGEHRPELLQTVPLEMFQGVDKIEVGMQFQAQSDQGVNVVTVAKVDGEEVTIDANHPLAGETLNFDVKVLEVREATEEELEHGHAHGTGGHQH